MRATSAALPAALTAVVLTSSFQFFAVPTADNDLWGHVLFGRRILAEGALPATNDYSYTAPGYPWINHEILAECALAWVWERFGSGGLSALRWIVGLGTLANLAAIVRRRGGSGLATAVALVLATSLMSFGFLPRPQIFTFLFLAIVWNLVDRTAEDPSSTSLLGAVPIAVLWTNTHGGVLAGLAVLAVAIPFLWRGHDRRAVVALAVAGSFVALFANPYGWRLPAFLLRDVTLERQITEWSPIGLLDLSNPQFKIACAAVVAGWVVLGVRRRPWEVLLVAAGALAAFRHQRHLPLFAILAAPHLAMTIDHGLRLAGFARSTAATRLSIATAACVLAVLQATSALAVHRQLDFGLLVPRTLYPVDAVRFLREHRSGGNLAVPFSWGEYAIWHLHPDFAVSIDGRYTTAYPDDVIEDAWRYMSGEEGWDRVLADADVALTDAREATAARLAKHPGWRLAYADPVASIFVKATEAASAPPVVLRSLPPRVEPSVFP